MPSVANLFKGKSATPISADVLINTLPDPLFVLDQSERIRFVNLAAEQFFQSSAKVLQTQGLSEIIPFDSPLLALVGQVRTRASSVSEYGLVLATPRIGIHNVDVQISPVAEDPTLLLVTLRERGIASKIDHQLLHRGTNRSIVSMAAVLAHEIKNPLSGIRGAAQLVEMSVGSEDKALLRLICEETDRIVALVDRMEVFSDPRPIDRVPINIHEVLEHVRRVAENGFAREVKFIELYDPSLPPVQGDRGMLIQVFLNLIKNAAEAVPADGGEITLTTAYRHGVRVAVPGTRERMNLPLEICVIDNGSGIPSDLQSHLFDPFVTTKPGGTGLGLALVAKIIGDHGGIIECDSSPRRTVFRVLLPTGPRPTKNRQRP
ncbi:ATP-binding protein [Iodidimonas sp. SYSU 1G8]|uniref:two-component system sensor histidine kinase NtrB n=1 Tax=Iodidimonas sp. SYSU 1G8 TaxID=3133967 RepID=UPI0031FE62FC